MIEHKREDAWRIKAREDGEARRAALKAADEKNTREFWEKWRKTAPLDVRGERLEASGVVSDPSNAARVHPEELAAAPHYKSMDEIRAVMEKARAGLSEEIGALEEAIAGYDRQLTAETDAKAAAMREGELEEYQEHCRTIDTLKAAREAADTRLRIVRNKTWNKLTPEQILALYESFVEVTDAEIVRYDKEIEKAERALVDARRKRAAYIAENNAVWRDFYRDVCHKPELYFKAPGRGYINTGAGIVPMRATGGALYKALQELKAEGGNK